MPTFAYRLFFTYKLLFLLKKVVHHKISSLNYKIVSSPAAIFVVFVLFVINIYDLIRLKLIKGSSPHVPPRIFIFASEKVTHILKYMKFFEQR